MFSFQHSQTTQEEFEEWTNLILKYSKVSARSKFDLGKIHSTIHLQLKPDADFKKQRASKVPIILKDKVKRLPVILAQYKIISPVNWEQQPKGNTGINPVNKLAKGESLKNSSQLQIFKLLNWRTKLHLARRTQSITRRNERTTLYHSKQQTWIVHIIKSH